ncbi:pleiotropic regulatory protein RsmS [Pseudoalteromonas sp. T1lg65]|uniref:pleiotropic regulatory protein RsmS n=1 Tax=Pseudoalteromonas sp. T1lg65 TaxID=2077101 RepID=UPI003F797308
MTTPLNEAPNHIKLAVDLIMLLEQHDIAPEEVLQALEIVKTDYQKKLTTNINN